jgi:hypothetical protein
MFESIYTVDGLPQPSGFRMKFSNSGWTSLHGTKNTSSAVVTAADKPISWSAGSGINKTDTCGAFYLGGEIGIKSMKSGGTNGGRPQYLRLYVCDGKQLDVKNASATGACTAANLANVTKNCAAVKKEQALVLAFSGGKNAAGDSNSKVG